MPTGHVTQEHMDPPEHLEEDDDPACGRPFGADPKRHRLKVYNDAGLIDSALLENTEWLFNIKRRESHSQTVHEITTSICNGEVFPCFWLLFNNFDHEMHLIGHELYALVKPIFGHYERLLWRQAFGVDARTCLEDVKAIETTKISKKTHAESIPKAMQTHIVQKTELKLVNNTMSIRPDIEAHHVAYVERILQWVSPSEDLLTLRSLFTRRPELSHLFLRMFLRTRLPDELRFRLAAVQKLKSNITNTTHLISWKRVSDRSFSKKVDRTTSTTKAIKIAVARYGMNAKSVDIQALVE